MPNTPDDEKTLAVPSSALLDDVPSTLDSHDDERTQKFAFDARELDAAIGALEDAAVSIPVTVAGSTPRAPLSRDARDAELAAPTTRPDRDFTPSGERSSGAAMDVHGAVTPARGTPASSPRPRHPDVAEKETVAPGSGRRASAKPLAATLPVASGMKSPLGAPPPDAFVGAGPAPVDELAAPPTPLEAAPAPAWFAGYVVTCVVLTVMGLVVLWFEHRALGHWLP